MQFGSIFGFCFIVVVLLISNNLGQQKTPIHHIIVVITGPSNGFQCTNMFYFFGFDFSMPVETKHLHCIEMSIFVSKYSVQCCSSRDHFCSYPIYVPFGVYTCSTSFFLFASDFRYANQTLGVVWNGQIHK